MLLWIPSPALAKIFGQLGTYNTIKATIAHVRASKGAYIHVSATLHYKGQSTYVSTPSLSLKPAQVHHTRYMSQPQRLLLTPVRTYCI